MKTTQLSIPQGLDDVANEWRKYIAENVTVNMTTDFSAHQQDTHSTYHMTIAFNKLDGPLVMHYAGRTGDPSGRASAHKSELKRCKTTTRTGKSVLYTAKYFEGVSVVDMHLKIHKSGYTLPEVLDAEKALADELKRLFGEEAILTRPRKS